MSTVLQNHKSVRNPLTVIAIFAGLAETFSCLALPRLTPEIQGAFVWFVMLFPFIIVTLFFATLNWNHCVLYAPSDFKSDENFLKTFRRDAERIKNDIVAEGESVRRSAEVFAELATLSLTNSLSPLEKATALTWEPYEQTFDRERRRLLARNNILNHLREIGSSAEAQAAVQRPFDEIITRQREEDFLRLPSRLCQWICNRLRCSSREEDGIERSTGRSREAGCTRET